LAGAAGYDAAECQQPKHIVRQFCHHLRNQHVGPELAGWKLGKAKQAVPPTVRAGRCSCAGQPVTAGVRRHECRLEADR